MKKIISLILALILVMSLGMVAFATDPSDGMGDHSITVTGSYVPGTASGDTLFSVELEWEEMSFTYHAKVAGEWDAEKHEYLPDTEAYWEGESTITVTNHSNAKLTATPKYTAASGYENATMDFSPSVLKIASAESSGQAETGTISVLPSGFLPKMESAATIGSITVTIAQDTNVTADEMQALIDRASALYEEVNGTSPTGELKSAVSSLKTYIDVVKGTLQDYKAGEVNQEGLNDAYADLLASYHAVLELK